VDAYPGRVWEARVSRLATVVDVTREQNRTVEVEVDVSRSRAIRRCAPAHRRRRDRARAQRLGAAGAERSRHGGPPVLKVERGRAVEGAVTIGLKSWSDEIRSGLGPGESW